MIFIQSDRVRLIQEIEENIDELVKLNNLMKTTLELKSETLNLLSSVRTFSLIKLVIM